MRRMRQTRWVGYVAASLTWACTNNVPNLPDSGASAGTASGSSTSSGGTSSGAAGTSTAAAAAAAAAAGGAATGTPDTTPAAAVTRLTTNPFVGAVMYQPADYSAAITANMAKAAAASPADARLISAVKTAPTGVWLDRIAAIAGGAANGGRLGLTGHLDAALAQSQTAGKPAVAVFVVYDLPNRDCKSMASNGELMGAAGLASYQSQFIDAIAAALVAKPDYSKLRVVLVIEPDSLPNMVTNATSVSACATVASQKLYTTGIAYALNKFQPLGHVYMYLDIAHSGWLGWDDKRALAVSLYAPIIKATKGAVRGLATNIANYTPVQETQASPSDAAMLSGAFYQSNKMFDELSYITALSTEFAAQGLPGLGFIIDTSRNGWAPAAAGQPQDRRLARGDWCNIKGTGLGARPQAAPGPHPAIDAFVWVKPPGESDGFSQLQNPNNTPDSEGKRFDPDCDSTQPSHLDSSTGAPGAGQWFNDDFLMLIRGAQPPL